MKGMGKPWNDWYHCNGNTHGTWVRGDERGWRSRHHREHVEGDYKHRPPKERDEHLRSRSAALMRHPPVLLTRAQALLAGAAMVSRLIEAKIELLSFALDDHHFHLVGRFCDHEPRRTIGLAKQRASYLLVQKFKLTAPIWAVRCRCLPIESRAHQVAAVNYDIKHAAKGAFFVWTFRDSVPVVETAAIGTQ